MDYSWADFQRQENGDPPAPVSYTADEVAEYMYDNPDDPDCEVLNMVMERDMASREDYWMRRALAAEARLVEYEDNDWL